MPIPNPSPREGRRYSAKLIVISMKTGNEKKN